MRLVAIVSVATANVRARPKPQAKEMDRARLDGTHKAEGGTFAKGNSQEQQDPPNVQREKAKSKDWDCYVKLYLGVGVNSGEQW